MPDTAETDPMLEVRSWVDSLESSQVEEELLDVVRWGGDKLLGKMMAQEELRVAAGVLDSFESAIGRVEDPSVQAKLGKHVVNSMIVSLEDVRADLVVPYAEHAGHFADFISDEPRNKVRSFLDIVEHTGKAWEAITTEPPTLAATTLGNDYLETAAEAARSIDDSDAKVIYLSEVAEFSVAHIKRTAQFEQSEEGAEVLATMIRQPVRLYGEAIAAAKQLPKVEDSLKGQGDIAISLIGSAADLRDIAPDVSRGLLADGLDALANVVDTHINYEGADLSPASKATHLGRLGGELAEVLGEVHSVYATGNDSPESEERAREIHLLKDQVHELFDGAQEHATQLGKLYRAGYDENFEGLSAIAVEAAGKMRSVDFDATLRLLSNGFEVAALEDLIHRQVRGPALEEVMRNIHRLAAREISLEGAFRLYALAHEHESGRVDWREHQVSELMVSNVDKWLNYLADAEPMDIVELDEIDRPFVEATVRAAVENKKNARHGVEALQNLAELVGDANLKERITEQLHILEIRKEAEEQEHDNPGSETARMIKAVVDSH